jgi:bone morphogenetic protein receptor type-2
VNVTCPLSKNYCYSVWSMPTNGTTRVIGQGCWEHREPCEQSSCIGYPQQQTSIFFCCCKDDFCNSNFKFQTTPKTSSVVDKNVHHPQKFIFHNSAIWISFVSTSIMLIIIAIVFVMSCREKPLKILQETSPCAPSGPLFSSNLYNVDNLKPISIIGEGK